MKDALGDLAVSIVELAKKPSPPYDQSRLRWGHELFEQLTIPPDMPQTHWWWFRDRPE